MKTHLPYIAYYPFFKFCPTSPPRLPCHLQPSPPLFFLFSFFFGWIGDHATFDVLFCVMIIWIYTCRALVPLYQKDLNVCFMQQRAKFTEVWHVFFLYWYSDLTLHTHINTHNSQGPLHGHTHKLIYIQTTCYVLTAATFITLND